MANERRTTREGRTKMTEKMFSETDYRYMSMFVTEIVAYSFPEKEQFRALAQRFIKRRQENVFTSHEIPLGLSDLEALRKAAEIFIEFRGNEASYASDVKNKIEVALGITGEQLTFNLNKETK